MAPSQEVAAPCAVDRKVQMLHNQYPAGSLYGLCSLHSQLINFVKGSVLGPTSFIEFLKLIPTLSIQNEIEKTNISGFTLSPLVNADIVTNASDFC